MKLNVRQGCGRILSNCVLFRGAVYSAALFLAAICCAGLPVFAQSQNITSPVTQTTLTPSTPGPQSGVPGTGPSGSAGTPGGYYCNQMTWGAACAAFYSFGSATTYGASNGNKAPSGASGVDISNNNPSVLFATPSGTPAGGSYDVVVTQLASAMRMSTSTAANLQDTTILNAGHAFDVILTPSGGSAVTIQMVAGSTLVDVKNAVNASFPSGTFTADTNAANGSTVLTVQGQSGSGHDFLLTTQARDAGGALVLTGGSPTAVTELSFSPPSAVTITDSNGNPTTYTPLGAQSQDALYTIAGGSQQSSASNNVTVSGFALNILNTGTSTLTVTPLSGAVPNGVAGTAGQAGSPINTTTTAAQVTMSGSATAFTYSTTGGRGGDAGIGGTGGTGGAGGVGVHGTIPRIMVIIFLPLTIPTTQSYALSGGIGGEGAQGGTGGQGGVGGIGGDIQFGLTSLVAKSNRVTNLNSTGGVGGTGGQGGQGGLGGYGATAVAAIESNNLWYSIVSAPATIGGFGGIGGTGGTGGTGGAGGGISLDVSITDLSAQTGHVLTSTGGQGGTGGLGGQGGQGGQGGNGYAFSDYVSNTTAVDAATGGHGGVGYTGGQGGVGGQGGIVTINNRSGTLTASNVGINAQSIGGIGGVGGKGGTGGTGGDGGVGDALSNYTTTSASSSGGNGGHAGDGGTGGKGGKGGSGGQVFVYNLGDTGTIIATVNAIHAASYGGVGGVGGIGGDGGLGGYGNAPGYIQPAPSYAGIAGTGGSGGTGGNAGNGGNGGAGGNGDLVQVRNEQTLSTTASYGSAILAESFGAIGGSGGAKGSVAGAGGSYWAHDPFYCINGISCDISNAILGIGPLAVASGGQGSPGSASLSIDGSTSLVGGNGGNVDVGNTGYIQTKGNYSDGITALSVAGVHGLSTNSNLFYWNGRQGGQDGSAGTVATSNSGTINTLGNNATGMLGMSMAIGSGSSGPVSLYNSGTVLTAGNMSAGLIAVSQSVSGNTTGGDSDAVLVQNFNAGVAGGIYTTGPNSTGVIAKSYAFSGNASSVDVDNTGATIVVKGTGAASAIVALSQSESTSGNMNAGPVTITNISGKIITQNASAAAAIDARSISAAGNSGDISLDNTHGFISTTGTLAVNLNSLASAGTSGSISVVSASDIISYADNGIALLLDSEGGSSAGTISITNGGLIQGGNGGHAIVIYGGNNNTITNTGTIATSGTPLDFVILASNIANDTINNNAGGIITGSIDLTQIYNGVTSHLDTNIFNNNIGATYNSGAVIMLGPATNAGNLFTNAGTISPGGLGLTMSPANSNGQTLLTGNFKQESTGQYIASLEFVSNVAGVLTQDRADLLHITGTADVAGKVTLSLASLAGGGKPGHNSVLIFTADGGLTNSGITLDSQMLFFGHLQSNTTAVFTPTMTVTAPNIYIEYDINYSPNGLTPNQKKVADVVNEIQQKGNTRFQPIANYLMSMPNVKSLGDALDSLSGEGTIAIQDMIFASRRQYMDSTMDHSGDQASCDGKLNGCGEGWHHWIDLQTLLAKSKTSEIGIADIRYNNTAVVAGSHYQMGNNFSAGFSIGGASPSFSVPSRWSSGQANGINVGTYANLTFDNGVYSKAMMTYGYYATDEYRHAIGQSVQGAVKTHLVGGQFELGWKFKWDRYSIAPFVGFKPDFQFAQAYSERDMNGTMSDYGNHVYALSVRTLPVVAGATFEGQTTLESNAVVKMMVRANVLHETDRTREQTSSFNVARDFRWTVEGIKPPNNAGEIEMRIMVMPWEQAGFYLNWKGLYSKSNDTKSGNIGMKVSF